MAQPAHTLYASSNGTAIHAGRWPGGRLTGNAELAAVVAAGLMAPNPSALSGDVVLDAIAAAGSMTSPLGVQTMVANGIWTYHGRPVAVSHQGYTYIGWCDNTGWAGCSRVNELTGATDRMALINTGEIDDHNNGGIIVLGDKLVVFGNTHNTPVIRYRVLSSLAQFTNAAAWSADTQVSSGLSYAYMNPMVLTKDPSRQYLFNRRWLNVGGSHRALGFNTTADMTAVPAVYSARVNICENADQDNAWPYWNLWSNGFDRVDVIINQCPQNVGQASVYHFYCKLDDSLVMRYYKTDGTEITAALPFNVADHATLVYDGSATRAWVSDVMLGADGHPRLLWPRMPGNNGAAYEYWYSRWTGSAWVNTKVVDGGQGFDGFPWWYPRGSVFADVDPSRVFAARTNASDNRDYLEEYRTADDGATWSLYRTIRDSSVSGARDFARPFAVKGNTGAIQVLWHEGAFANFNSYTTDIVGAG